MGWFFAFGFALVFELARFELGLDWFRLVWFWARFWFVVGLGFQFGLRTVLRLGSCGLAYLWFWVGFGFRFGLG